MRKNPELKPLRQSIVVYNLILATPALALVPDCNGFAVPLDQSVTWRRGTCYTGNSRSSIMIYHRLGIHPWSSLTDGGLYGNVAYNDCGELSVTIKIQLLAVLPANYIPEFVID